MEKFTLVIQKQFTKMCATGKLFRSSISGKDIYKKYLESFEDGDDPVFRDPESSVHNCNNCYNFIKRYGNIVAISDKGKIMTLFDGVAPAEFKVVAKKLKAYVSKAKIQNVFFETYEELKLLPYESCNKTQDEYRLGMDKNHKRYTREEAEKFGVVKANEIRTFHHVFLDLPKAFVDQSGNSIEAIAGKYRDKYSVFERAMKEIPLDTLHLVRDLINQGSLLDGTAHLHSIEGAIRYKDGYTNTTFNKSLYCWYVTHGMDERESKFRNTLIGVLCTELAEGMELNKACENWNKRVDPANYHKAVAPITQRQIDEAQKFVTDNGYIESFDRRLATMDDINVSEIKHVSTSGAVKPVTIFDKVKSTPTQHKRAKYDDVEEVAIDKFMKDILPTCSSVEALLTNKQSGNLVTLTTANQQDSKAIFKWNNNYSWNFNGNLAGKSQIKEAVKSQGGGVDGVLRFSIMWAEDTVDNSDLDAHCEYPNRGLIYYSRKVGGGGVLDIDITQPQSHKRGGKKVVENITFASVQGMRDGEYTFKVHQFSARQSKGFTAEIEFDGQLYEYSYPKAVSGKVTVATVTLKDGQFSIKHSLESSHTSREVWGLDTEQFHKVNLVCLSPNHWGDNAVGNKHYMFMLDGCKNPLSTRGFHNENLKPDLLKHRKVMEVLGATNMIEPADKQLSGLGFNSTVNDEVVLKLAGTHKRMVKVKF